VLEAGRGRLVLLAGESGSGKTRLAMELCRRAARRGADVLVGECEAHGSDETAAPGQALQALRRPLRMMADQCRENGAAEAMRLFADRATLLALYEPSLAALLGVEADPEPAELPPDAARLRLFEALTQSFSALAETRPCASASRGTWLWRWDRAPGPGSRSPSCWPPNCASCHRSKLRQALERLRRAQAAFETDDQDRLFRGEPIEDLPLGLRRWLVESGHLQRERAGLPEA
jgi:AAA ATPase-like protein